ncbi:MAG: sulfatase-like hydrolase/transferase [Lachnospiraceae bacterium]
MFKENWNLFNVYSELGFDEFYDGDSVSDGEQMRWMLSDYADFQKIIELYENKEEDNLFIFNVTMQNHGGYEGTWDNFANTVDLSAQGDFPQAEQYFSLIKETDAAFKELIDYFEKVDEPTLICFFGIINQILRWNIMRCCLVLMTWMICLMRTQYCNIKLRL